jgi:hypothetical protein
VRPLYWYCRLWEIESYELWVALILNFIKIRPSVLELKHADRWTDERHKKNKRYVSLFFAHRAKKTYQANRRPGQSEVQTDSRRISGESQLQTDSRRISGQSEVQTDSRRISGQSQVQTDSRSN